MTSKQKSARATFKKVVAEAKKLRNKNPRLSQAQAVKQAWAIYKSGGISGIGKVKKVAKKKTATKKVAKKKSPLVATRQKIKRVLKKDNAILPHGYVLRKGSVRNLAGLHKDTASHNTNIHVLSGMAMGNLNQLLKDKERIEKDLDSMYEWNSRKLSPYQKNILKKMMKEHKTFLQSIKTQIALAKRNIK